MREDSHRKNTVLVTGASGFAGSSLTTILSRTGRNVIPVQRSNAAPVAGKVDAIERVKDYSSIPSHLLESCEAIVHCAAIAHRFDHSATHADFHEVNAVLPVTLCRRAAAHGVSRFLFLSTTKVLGESSTTPLTEQHPPKPPDAYSEAKLAAEKGLRDLARNEQISVTVLRPPLMYGAGVGANFLRLIKLVEKKLPLPFGLLANKRSLLYVGNLGSAVEAVLTSERAGFQLFHVTDGVDLSVRGLVGCIARNMGVTTRLVPVPPALLVAAATFAGSGSAARRLTEPSRIDSSLIQETFDWSPPFTPREGISSTVAWYSNRASSEGHAA